MSLTVKHFNTWAASLAYEHRPDYFNYLREHADDADVLHLSEVHSCTDDTVPEFVMPEDKGHRIDPLHVKQLQRLQQVLSDTHDVHFVAQLRGLHDLDDSQQSVLYGNVTCVRKGLMYDIKEAVVFGNFGDLNTEHAGGTPAAKSAHSILLIKDGKCYQSGHTHGHWHRNGKVDTPHRFMQFTRFMEFLDNHRTADPTGMFADALVIAGGDFNLTSECEALEVMRQASSFVGDGVILNHEFAEPGQTLETRTGWYPKEKPHREANFVIVDPRAYVEYFSVDDSAPSDHCMITTVLS